MPADADSRRSSRALPLTLTAVLASILASPGAGAQTPQLLWSNPWSNAATVPSRVWTSPVADVEAADDFTVNGTITRVIFEGHDCFSCAPASVSGVLVRFYASQGGLPGALLAQDYLPVGVPLLSIDPGHPSTVDFTLTAPFVATGAHFVSMQVLFSGGGYWDVWISRNGNPTQSPLRYRNNAAGGTWGPYQEPWMASPMNADLTFSLWGFPPGPPPALSDPCGTWTDLATPGPAAASDCKLRDVAVITPDGVWAVGQATTTIASSIVEVTTAMHWDGIGWTIVPTPNPTAAPGLEYCTLNAVDGIAPNDVWAAGTQRIAAGTGAWVGQQVLILHWDGAQWSVMPAPMPPNTIGAGVGGAWAYDLKAIASNDVWFVGRWIDLFPSGMTAQPGLLTHYDGSTFTQMSVPIVSSTGNQAFRAVDATGPNDVWAVGGAASSVGGSTVPVVHHWNGSQWTHTPPVTNGDPIDFYDVDALLPNSVVAAGIYTGGTSAGIRVLFVWNGSSWTTLPGPPQGNVIKVFAPTQIYSIGPQVHRWDGASWTLTHQFGGPTSSSVQACDATSPCELWGVGGQFLANQARPFASRIDSNRYWKVTPRAACLPGGAPAALIEASAPKLGTVFSVSISDSLNTLGSATGLGASYWFVSAAPIAAGGCGLALPTGGALGLPGELLIDPAQLALTLGPVYTPGPGMAATHSVALPSLPSLAGITGYTQGVMVDFSNPSRLVLTNALDARLGY